MREPNPTSRLTKMATGSASVWGAKAATIRPAVPANAAPSGGAGQPSGGAGAGRATAPGGSGPRSNRPDWAVAVIRPPPRPPRSGLRDIVDDDAGVVDGANSSGSTPQQPNLGLSGHWGDRSCMLTSATPSSRRQCRSSSAFGLRALHIDPGFRMRQGAAMEATQWRRFPGKWALKSVTTTRPEQSGVDLFGHSIAGGVGEGPGGAAGGVVPQGERGVEMGEVDGGLLVREGVEEGEAHHVGFGSGAHVLAAALFEHGS